MLSVFLAGGVSSAANATSPLPIRDLNRALETSSVALHRGALKAYEDWLAESVHASDDRAHALSVLRSRTYVPDSELYHCEHVISDPAARFSETPPLRGRLLAVPLVGFLPAHDGNSLSVAPYQSAYLATVATVMATLLTRYAITVKIIGASDGSKNADRVVPSSADREAIAHLRARAVQAELQRLSPHVRVDASDEWHDFGAVGPEFRRVLIEIWAESLVGESFAGGDEGSRLDDDRVGPRFANDAAGGPPSATVGPRMTLGPLLAASWVHDRTFTLLGWTASIDPGWSIGVSVEAQLAIALTEQPVFLSRRQAQALLSRGVLAARFTPPVDWTLRPFVSAGGFVEPDIAIGPWMSMGATLVTEMVGIDLGVGMSIYPEPKPDDFGFEFFLRPHYSGRF